MSGPPDAAPPTTPPPPPTQPPPRKHSRLYTRNVDKHFTFFWKKLSEFLKKYKI